MSYDGRTYPPTPETARVVGFPKRNARGQSGTKQCLCGTPISANKSSCKRCADYSKLERTRDQVQEIAESHLRAQCTCSNDPDAVYDAEACAIHGVSFS